MNLKLSLLIPIAIISMAFTKDSNPNIEFNYPKNKKSKVSIEAGIEKGFSKEWRGKDYYFSGILQDSIICSVLYYKLNDSEKDLMVAPFGGMTSPGIPMIYFSGNSNLKPYEKNSRGWGEMTDDFMFRQADVPEFNGTKVNQKHMYAYGMFGDDLFLNVHLSKTNCSKQDSISMVEILTSIKKTE